MALNAPVRAGGDASPPGGDPRRIVSAMTAWGESEEGLVSAPWLARSALVAGRKDPRLGCAELQVAGEDLAWSADEVAEVLRRWGRPISDEQVAQIAWISEGWCAVVRLAAAAGPAVLSDTAATLDFQLMRDAAATVSPELFAAAIELSAVDQFDAATD